MTDEAYTYHLWHLHAYRDGADEIVQTNITPGESSILRDPSAEFIATLLQDAGVEGQPRAWDCLAYRSPYQGDSLSDRWEDLWPVNWRLRMRFERPPRIPRWRYESTGTHAHSVESSIGAEDPAAALPCLIIADFDSNAAAVRAGTALSQIGKFPIHIWAIDSSIVQLQCELDSYTRDQYVRGIPLVTSVIDACETEGGYTSFDERVEELGEAGADE